MWFLQRVFLTSSLLFAATSAFSARKASQMVRSSTSSSSSASSSSSSSSSLSVGAVWMEDDEIPPDFLLRRAEACVGSETCSLEEAQTFLDDILHVQAQCVGALSSKSPVCDNVDQVVEVVANLRHKIETERERLAPVRATVHLFNVAMGVYVVSTILHGIAAVPNVPVDTPLVSSFGNSFPMEGATNARGVAAILPQEWLWSIRDGYFPALFREWVENGGLRVDDVSALDQKVVSIAPREWVWSMQNGSFGRLLAENMQHGGLVVDADFDFDTEGSSPMTPEEVLWSIQGGYFGTAMQHLYRNGGV